MARELRGRGLVYIDSPVTGLPDAAAAGKLTLLVGADAADLERARPFLIPLATTIRHFGAVGTGTVYKLINNLMGAIQIAGIAEGLAIAEQAGLDMKLVLEAVETGVGRQSAGDPAFPADGGARILPARRSRRRCAKRMRPMRWRWPRACCRRPRHGACRGCGL